MPRLAFTDAVSGRPVELSVRVPGGAFAAVKLAPDRNNLRTVLAAAGGSAAPAQAGQEGPALAPSPAYNGSILHDMLRHALCVELAGALPLRRQRDAARLLRVWLQAQVPRSAHSGALLHGVLVALGAAVRARHVVRSRTSSMHVTVA